MLEFNTSETPYCLSNVFEFGEQVQKLLVSNFWVLSNSLSADTQTGEQIHTHTHPPSTPTLAILRILLPRWKTKLKQMNRLTGQCWCSLLCDNCKCNTPKHQQYQTTSFCHAKKCDLFLAGKPDGIAPCLSDLMLFLTTCSISDFVGAILLHAK